MSTQKNWLWLIGITTVVIIGVLFIFRQSPSDQATDAEWTLPSVTSTPALVPSDAPMEGPFSAKVTLVEFLDYECPGCAAYHPIIKNIRQRFAGRIRFVVRQFPLVEIHANAKGASIAALCAQRQNTFFEYSDYLFEHRDNLKRADLEAYAKELQLDENAFTACLDDRAVLERVARDRVEGEYLGVQGTPTMFLNGRMVPDLPEEEALAAMIEKELGN